MYRNYFAQTAILALLGNRLNMSLNTDNLCFSDMTQGSAGAKTNKVPVPDQQVALALQLELAVQRGSLHHLLNSVLLLLNLWSSSRHNCDNRYVTNLVSAPLLPLLRRLEQVEAVKTRAGNLKNDDVSKLYF